MTTRIHLSIMQPAGYIHSQGFLDQARYARYQFRRLGAQVTIGKNRLREDSINIVLGAHLGFDPGLKLRHTCVFVNLEQLGEGGASVSQAYMDLLRSSAVIDYDERNLEAYGCKPGDVPLVSFQWAPYLRTQEPLPVADRPIDLLFFGSMNPRRKALFSRIEACGWSVSMFDHPLYGEERDQFIRQAKSVFNCHFYETSRFEQARAFHTLSLGTPVISERTDRTTPPPAFEDAVTWVSDATLEDFFRDEFMTPAWIERTEDQLRNFAAIDALPAWTVAYNYCLAVQNMNPAASDSWLPIRMSIGSGSGEHYKLGWLNVDTQPKAQADVLIDWNEPKDFPLRTESSTGTLVTLNENQLDQIHARHDLTRESNPYTLMGNLLRLLKPEGRLEMEIPVDTLLDLTQEPGKPASVNTASWERVSQRFWELGSLQHRLEILDCGFVDANSMACDPQRAANVRITFSKTETSAREKTSARVFLPDFGGTEDDEDWLPVQKPYQNATENRSLQSASGQGRPMRFIFYTPHYDDNSGGLIAIYKLAHMLNESGHVAKIWHWTRLHENEVRMINGKVAKEFFIPQNVSLADVDCPYPIIEAAPDDIRDSIVIYPEIIEGNPLGAEKVVRWLLNKPGALTGATSYGFGDLIFYFAEHFLPEGFVANESFRLKIEDLKTHIYKNNYEGKRQGVYYMIRKGRDIPPTYHPENALQVDGKSHAELAEIFAKAQMFISYDLHTAYSLFASLCGCDSVVVPRPGMSKEQWKIGKDQSDLDGIAYGYEDIERSRKTRHAMIARVHRGQAINVEAMNNFLATCERYLTCPGRSS
jgi:hypothetical protein